MELLEGTELFDYAIDACQKWEVSVAQKQLRKIMGVNNLCLLISFIITYCIQFGDTNHVPNLVQIVAIKYRIRDQKNRCIKICGRRFTDFVPMTALLPVHPCVNQDVVQEHYASRHRLKSDISRGAFKVMQIHLIVASRTVLVTLLIFLFFFFFQKGNAHSSIDIGSVRSCALPESDELVQIPKVIIQKFRQNMSTPTLFRRVRLFRSCMTRVFRGR
mmetsp:Transcript_5288/g.15383  ORF Transcript_5288/g.15383 Transcript_5288/m.15383 type:complete len:217 (-) Transcript_5288:1640-2290(-)